MNSIVKASLDEALSALQTFASKDENVASIATAASFMAHAIKDGHKIMSCGNGGSMSDAMHFAEELTGRYRQNRIALPAIALSNPAHITCVANDFSNDDIFSRYVEGIGQSGDVLLAISTSGRSGNILKAVESAKAKGIRVVGLTCDTENPLRAASDVAICAPRTQYADRIQEIHIKCIHIMIQMIEHILFD